jgi:hypothetical protein
MGFATEEQLPGIPWMYGLPALFEVGFFTPVQTIFLVKTPTVPTEQGHPFRARIQRCPHRLSSQQAETDNEDFDGFYFAQRAWKHRQADLLLA